MAEVQKITTEEVTGKSVNLCHIIANPDYRVLEKLVLELCAIAIISVSPGEFAVIAADKLSKAANVKVVFIDRFLGTVLLSGALDDLEAACEEFFRCLKINIPLNRVVITKS